MMHMKRITALAAAAMLTFTAAQADWTCTDPSCRTVWDDSVTICDECGADAPLHGLTVPVIGRDFVRLQWYGPTVPTDVYYRAKGSSAWLDGGNTSRNNIKLSGLTMGVTYEVMLYADNGDVLNGTFSLDGGATATPVSHPVRSVTPTPTPRAAKTPTPRPAKTPTPKPVYSASEPYSVVQATATPKASYSASEPYAVTQVTATPRPGGTITVKKNVTVNKGMTTVYWDAPSGSGPFTVLYTAVGNAGVKQPNYFANGSKENATTSAKQMTINGLVPGCSYDIQVDDSKGNTAKGRIYVPSASYINDGELKYTSITGSASPRSCAINADWSEAKTIASLKASTIISNMSTTDYGVYYTIKFPTLKRDHTYENMMVAVKSPNGFITSSTWNNVTFAAGHEYHQWTYCLGNRSFRTCFEYNKALPTGTWTIELYLDGQLANTTTFRVN